MTDYASDALLLHGFVERWWSHRRLHEHLDGVNVDAVFASLVDRLREVPSIWQCAITLRDTLWELMDGHLRLGATHWRAETLYLSGLHCMPVAEGVAVVDLAPRLSAPPAPSRGDLIVEADGQFIDDYLASVRLRPGSTVHHRHWNAVQSLVWQERMPEEKPSPRTVTIEDVRMNRRTLALAWEPATMSRPTPFCVTARSIRHDVGLLDVRSFVCRDALGQISDAEMLRQVSAACDRLKAARHVIVDLRGNSGGRDEQAQILARMLPYSPAEWMRVSRRNPETGDMEPPAAIPLETGPPALAADLSDAGLSFLLGPGCASTAEIVAAAFEARPETRTVGDTTAGSAGDPAEFRLPQSLLSVSVPIADYFRPGTGTSIEGHGIAPATRILQTAEDLRRGVDATVAAAVAAIS